MLADAPITRVKIFVASGSDLKKEREQTILILNKLNKSFPHLHLEPIEWETDIPPGSYDGKIIQDEINPLLEQCDIMLVLFYSKVGKFTLEEFQLALQKKKKVFLYFRSGFTTTDLDLFEQYRKVLEFRKEVETENKLLYKGYDTPHAFQQMLYEDLNLYVLKTYPITVPKPIETDMSLPSVREKLLSGSKTYYEALRGDNGRFRFLNISEIILPSFKGVWFETPVSINPSDSASPNEKLLPEVQGGGFLEKSSPGIINTLPGLWKNKVRHAVIVGDGGMGKTVSLIHLWSKFLETGNDGSIPIYIALNELNQVPEGKRENFILSYIIENYGNGRTTLTQLKKIMTSPLTTHHSPTLVLLLDGFNEITVEKRELLIELNRLVEQCPGIQIVISSRYDMRRNFNWGHWNLVKLQELDNDKVTQYLQERGMAVPEQGQERLLTLLKNPMMLTLYAATCEVQKKHKGSTFCSFKEKVETPGELLWNFMEAQVGNLLERLGQDIEQVYYYKFLLKFFLPALGFEMEKAGLFDFTVDQMDECINRICKHSGQSGFLDTFREFEEHIDKLPIGDSADDKERRKQRVELKKILSDGLHMIVKDGESLRFLHQNFRDFFAAVHVLNEVEMSIRKKEIPNVLKERILDYYIRRMVGELEGEHYSKASINEAEKAWRININKENRLYRALELCRGKFDHEVGHTVWNIVTIWKELRGELSGADLSRLDLTGVGLNGMRCCRFYGEEYLAAVFNGSRIHEMSVLPQGHNGEVHSVVYSSDGKTILSASIDKTIKEWNVATGECVKTVAGHNWHVNSAVYSRAGEKILSASRDNTIKVWNAATGQCLKTLVGHSGYVLRAVYSPDGKKILSASSDHTIKEWNAGTSECAITFAGHTNWVNSAVYSRDGEKILSASYDKTIKEWNTRTGECVKTLTGHSGYVLSAGYSPDGEKILSASWDNTIKVWEVATGECVKTLTGHNGFVTSAMYSADGKKILSASWGGTIKEWDGDTGECVKTFAGHTGSVTSAVYSPDGEKIFSSSVDRTIKEWDGATGECIKTLAGHKSYVNSAVYSWDGKKILSASVDRTIKELNVATGECVKILIGHTGYVASAVYSKDGNQILSASWDNTIKEWDAETGQCLKTYDRNAPNIPKYLYDEINKKLRRDDNKIIVQDASGQAIKELVNVPGLFIQGCSFQNLEKESQWSEKGLELMRMYNAKISIAKE